jgi:hypothetical protein
MTMIRPSPMMRHWTLAFSSSSMCHEPSFVRVQTIRTVANSPPRASSQWRKRHAEAGDGQA